VLGNVPTFGEDRWDFFDDGFTSKIAPGGGALNLACGARSLGASVAVVAKTGADVIGEYLIQYLDSLGVETRWISQTAKMASAVLLVAVDNEGERYFTGFRAANNFIESADFPEQALAQCRCAFFMGASFRPAAIRDQYLAFMRRAKEAGLLVAMDALFPKNTEIEYIRQTLELADIVLLNEEELFEVAGTREFDRAGALLSQRTKGVIAIKRGARGSVVITNGDRIVTPAQEVQVVDTTGAGDAFNAAFLVARIRGKGWVEASQIANLAGGIAVQQLGGSNQLPPLSDLEAQIKDFHLDQQARQNGDH
jgi:sugar/nucleoside kinase (ribokinase family)